MYFFFQFVSLKKEENYKNPISDTREVGAFLRLRCEGGGLLDSNSGDQLLFNVQNHLFYINHNIKMKIIWKLFKLSRDNMTTLLFSNDRVYNYLSYSNIFISYSHFKIIYSLCKIYK